MPTTKKLTLLHSNDMHGDFLAETIDSALLGGVSMLSGYVRKVRSEEENVIYAIAGDMFRGSVIDSEYKGLSTIEIMNLLAPDVVTLGNHEVDYGVAHLLFIEKCAKFPIINANMHITTNRARLFRPYHIIRVGGMNVLFIGILTEDVLSQTKGDKLVGSFINVGEAADEVGRICNSYKTTDIDLTVLLTHIGFEEDKKLAAMLDPEWGVDIIVGGHSHTMPDEPCRVNDVLIVQAGCGTDQIGRFDISVDTDLNAIDSFEWRLVPITSADCPRDTELEELILSYKTKTDDKYMRVITRFDRELTHPARNRETEIGNLFCDIIKEALGVNVLLIGSGSIRKPALGPVVTFASLCEVFPFDASIYMIKTSGAALKRMLAYMLREEAFSAHTEFYQVSGGLEVTWSRREGQFVRADFEGRPLRDDQELTVGLQKYHLENFEKNFGFPLEQTGFPERKPRALTTSCFDILDEYLSTHSRVERGVEGRIHII